MNASSDPSKSSAYTVLNFMAYFQRNVKLHGFASSQDIRGLRNEEARYQHVDI
jgi:hypothetical protein